MPAMRLIILIVFCLYFAPATLWAKSSVVGVSILPQKYFVERIAGDQVEVIVMVGDGYNPVTYEPKPKQLAQLNNALVFFLADVPFEKKWIRVFKSNYPNLKLVSIAKDIKFRKFHLSENGGHSHQVDQHGEQLDPHFWLNPLMVKIAAKTIRDTLSELDPQRVSIYEKNYQAFVNDLHSLDQYIRDKINNTQQKTFAVFHPSWGYFADAYGLKQIAIEVQNRQSGARTLNSTINAIKQNKVKTIFVQKQFSEVDAGMVARETGSQLISVNHLAENYIENMKHVANVFQEALR